MGLALPVGLALGVYVASAGSLAAVPAVVEASADVARAATSEAVTTPGPTTTVTGEDDAGDNLPGKCRKPENSLDPDCDPRSADEDDSSGPGSGGGDDDSSGPGSGGDEDDDSSGHGSGGEDEDDSSGEGSDDDD